MLNCKEATALMSQGLDRHLGRGERLRLRLHLMMCSACTNYRRQMNVLRMACLRLSGRG